MSGSLPCTSSPSGGRAWPVQGKCQSSLCLTFAHKRHFGALIKQSQQWLERNPTWLRAQILEPCRTRVRSQLHHLLDVWPWVSDFNFLGLRFHFWKLRMVMNSISLFHGSESEMKDVHLRHWLITWKMLSKRHCCCFDWSQSSAPWRPAWRWQQPVLQTAQGYLCIQPNLESLLSKQKSLNLCVWVGGLLFLIITW